MKFLMIGFGSIGQGLMPLIQQYFPQCSTHIITLHKKGQKIAKQYEATIEFKKITKNNYEKILSSIDFDILINVSVNVSSLSLIEWCQNHDKLYIDTGIEPWAGGYQSQKIEETTNYFLREQIFKLKRETSKKSTAIISHGANPGLISHLVKAALDELSIFFNMPIVSYPQILHDLDIQVIQVAEEDTQVSSKKFNHNTFVNTWSVDGLISEAYQQAELGSQENLINSTKYSIHNCSFGDTGRYLNTKGFETQVKSWTPSSGELVSYMITHNESLSISEKFEYQNKRPTVYYAYRPSPHTISSWHLFEKINDKKINKYIMKEDIISGHDELGALLISPYFSYWFGSALDSSKVSTPYNSATSIQVTISIIAAILWMKDNPEKGIIEAEEIPHTFILDIAKDYLGEYGGVFTDFSISDLKLENFLI